MKTQLSRRSFLKAAGIAGAGALSSGLRLPAFAQDQVVLRWWDHFSPFAELNERVWAEYLAANHPNVSVEHTVFSPPDLAKSIQLAFPSGQAPDVHTLADVTTPTAALVDEGWFTPLQPYVTQEWLDSLPSEAFLEGITMFRGELYSFPLFSFRWHININWFNKDMMADAGYDPEVGPVTWDDFRDAGLKMTQNGNGMSFGWIQGHGHIDRNSGNLINFAQIAGAPGEIDWMTGEYVYASDPYLTAMEFMVSLAKDGILLPGTTALDTRNARARWAAGAGGMFLDGPWNPGVVKGSFPEFMDKIGVAQVPVMEASQVPVISRDPNGGDFWISSQSTHAQIAAELMMLLTSEEYQVTLAETMDQPPINAASVAKANVHPSYRRGLELETASTRLGPVPNLRNAAVTEVKARMTDIHPNLGEIVQGVIAGDVTDYATALKDYQDKLSAEREKAIAAAQADGFEVSQDDWVFPNWERGTDYTREFYEAL